MGGCSGPPVEAPVADLILHGGAVVTVDAGQPSASAVAVRQGRIVFVGNDAGALALRGPTTAVIPLAGRTLLPGFADGHLHLFGMGDALVEVDLVGTASYAEVIARVVERAAATPSGQWIIGRGWDQNDWQDTSFPHHAELSAAVPHHPVALGRVDGHALLANATALAAAGVFAGSVAPSGGRILTDDTGAPTGVLVDAAEALVTAIIPELSVEERGRRLLLAVQHLNERGVTSVHEAGIDRRSVELLAAVARAGLLSLRVHVMVSAHEPALHQPRAQTGWPTDDLTGQGLLAVRAIKAYMDGALGSRGAALLAPYSDDPHQDGLLLMEPVQLLELSRFAAANDWQLCTHAIGDRGNRLVLDAYEQALGEFPRDDHRFRVEHAQILDSGDIPRFAQLGVLPSMQAQHQTSDMPWAGERLGQERLVGAYAWASLLASGVIIPGGSDGPVEAVDVPAALHAAVTRTDAAGQPEGGWMPEQRMTREQALLHVTLWPALAAFREHDLGSITVGKRADLVVLSGNPLSVPEDQLPLLTVELTVFDGQVVFDRSPPR